MQGRDYGKYGLGNITLKERYGHKAKMLLLCRTCSRTFSENRGKPFFRLRISYEQLYKILRSNPRPVRKHPGHSQGLWR
ncbi:hypothetical protein KEJ19_03730 [Candidatus Bathyarchaeota archaeon]|nr:hypothetical protein [Candidatus Bathyarchaeota archaeon]